VKDIKCLERNVRGEALPNFFENIHYFPSGGSKFRDYILNISSLQTETQHGVGGRKVHVPPHKPRVQDNVWRNHDLFRYALTFVRCLQKAVLGIVARRGSHWDLTASKADHDLERGLDRLTLILVLVLEVLVTTLERISRAHLTRVSTQSMMARCE
jgi:hypothetical protein